MGSLPTTLHLQTLTKDTIMATSPVLNNFIYIFLNILLLIAVVRATNVDKKRKVKLFFISTSSSTATVSSSTNCYVAAASVTACGRKRRAIEYIDDEVRGVFGPSSPRWNNKDEDEILTEEFDKYEGIVGTGMNDATYRKGKFLLYWKTSTLTSTSTSYTATWSIGTIDCAPTGFSLNACG